ncbi:conserved protein of unknown function [Methanocaldococcus lauensis]|nr:conserved protein of unknown function [Methanocaldococcus lauensis]
MKSKVKVTLELPALISKKEAIEILKKEALKKKFKKTKLFEKYSKNKDIAFEIAEYVEKYLKKYHKNLNFNILLDYDLDDEMNIICVLVKDIDSNEKIILENKLYSLIDSKFEDAPLYNAVIIMREYNE